MNNNNLTLQELEFVQNEVKSNKKSILGAYVLTALLWPIGVGRAYLGKQKSAIARIALTITMIGIVAVMMNFSLTLEAEEIAKQLVSSTAIAMSLVVSSLISLVMLIVELVSIPRWAKEIDIESWDNATEKAIKGRYVSEQLLKDNLSQFLIDEIKAEVKEEVNKETEVLISKIKEDLINGSEFLPKSIAVFDEVAPDEDDPINEIDKYLNIETEGKSEDDDSVESDRNAVSDESSITKESNSSGFVIVSDDGDEIEINQKNNSESSDNSNSLSEPSNIVQNKPKNKRRKKKKVVRRRKKEVVEENEFVSINEDSKGVSIGEILKNKDVDISKLSE